MPDQAEEDNDQDNDCVVHTEVSKIGLDSCERIGDTVRQSHGVEIEHHSPSTARG
uniref:Uncharacterized protein n=1 Tax=Arabidopsis thaliana TaxID=3702 RepID=Q0WUF5_ARATH|nr:hypothetical protein [Arabidopsis thaliana]